MSQYFLTLSSWTIAEMPCCLGRFFWNLVARLVQILREIKESCAQKSHPTQPSMKRDMVLPTKWISPKSLGSISEWNWLSLWTPLMLPTIFCTGVRNQSVCHLYHSWCWATLHVPLTLQWLQFCSTLQLHVRVYHHNHLVYWYSLHSAGAIEWRQFCSSMLL